MMVDFLFVVSFVWAVSVLMVFSFLPLPSPAVG